MNCGAKESRDNRAFPGQPRLKMQGAIQVVNWVGGRKGGTVGEQMNIIYLKALMIMTQVSPCLGSADWLGSIIAFLTSVYFQMFPPPVCVLYLSFHIVVALLHEKFVISVLFL